MPHHNRLSREGQHRDGLAGEHKFGDSGQIIFAALFAAIWVSDSLLLHCSTFLNHYVPIGIRIPIGITLLAIAAFLSGKGIHIIFVEKRDKPSVIQKSVFSVTRHPVYLGEILVYLGLFALNMSLAALGICVAAAVFLHYISRYEEKLLLERFGKLGMLRNRIGRGFGFGGQPMVN